MTDYTEILLDIADGVALITLNRPDRLNAFTATMARELRTAFDATDADDDVRVVVITGAGRAFCAGPDMTRGVAAFTVEDEIRAAEHGDFGRVAGVLRDGGGYVSLRIAASRKPVIAAINGPAVGVGATMTLPADIRLAGQNARFGFVFARRGLIPEAASAWFLPQVVGVSQAMEWVATGRIFDAQEALTGRLVSRIVADELLLPTAYGIAAEIAENTSAVSVSLSRRMMWSMLGATTPWEAHRLDSQAIHGQGQAPDAAEGAKAFLRKRSPKFSGRISEFSDVVPDRPVRPADMD